MTKSLFFIRACIGLISTTHQNIATAFITPSHKVRTQYGLSPPLKAIVYYPDDYVNEDPAASMDQAAYNINSDIFNESPLSQLADRLFSNQDNASVLARLASAYSPPGYSIDLSNISNVRCLCVDTKHLEIEAVVCDNYECSSLLVPVDFPKECNLDYGLEECVLNNVQNLDKQGDDLIQDRMHAFADEEEAQKAYEVFKLVGASDYLKPSPTKFPEWWVPPTSSEDVSECNMIEKLLNEADWQLEMRELCKHALQESGDAGFSYEDEVQLALVKGIGPSGMVLEAHVSRGGKSVYDYGGMNNIAILYVPIKFPLEGTGGNASIRDHVLGIVSSVNA